MSVPHSPSYLARPALDSSARSAEFELPRPTTPERELDSLRFAFDAERMGAWEYDLVAARLSWSAGCASLFGFEAAPGSGSPERFLERLHPEDRTVLVAAARAGLADERTLELELRVVLADGGVRWVLVRGRGRRDAVGRVERVTGVVVDITDRRRHEDELRAKEARLVQANALLAAVNRVQNSLATEELEHAAERWLEDLLALADCERVVLGRLVPGSAAAPEFLWTQRAKGPHAPASLDPELLARSFAFPIAHRLPRIEAETVPGCASPGLLGVPLCVGGALVGVLGFAGREGGFEPEFVGWLEPMTTACARRLDAHSAEARRRAAEENLRASEERLRSVLRATNDVVWDWDLARGELLWSVRYAELFGYPLADLGMSVAECDHRVHPDDRPALDASLRAAIEGGAEYWTHDYRYRAADGSWRHVHDRGFVLRDADGRARRMIGALQDVTRERESALALRASEARFRSVYEQALVAMARTTLDGRVLDANPAFSAMLGYTRDELTSSTVEDLTHPDDWPENLALRRAVVEGRLGGFQIEKRYRRKHGSWFWARLNVTLVRDAAGRPECFFAVIEDVTERKEAERALRELNQELERRVQERTTELRSTLSELESFSYSVSHDLRAPLRGMDGWSQVLLEEHSASLDPAGREILQRIRANCSSMSRLIDGLLALSRLSRDEIAPERVDLAPIAREIIERLRAAEPEREVEFLLSGDLHAHADPRLARTLVENLLGNAWKFTARKPRAHIEFYSVPGPTGERTFCVRDDGAGFESEHSRRLFQPFERLHSQAEFPGSGIGLATVQRIVRRHGGDVRIEGAPSAGARVCFTLGPC